MPHFCIQKRDQISRLCLSSQSFIQESNDVSKDAVSPKAIMPVCSASNSYAILGLC